MRHATALLALAALALGLAACGGGHGPMKLFIWEQMDPKEQVLLDAHLETYLAGRTDLLVERVHYETEALRTQFQNAALAGGGPELIYGPGDQVGPFSIMGLIDPLEGLFAPAMLDSFNPESLIRLARPGESEAHLWALPDQVGNHLILCFNKKLIPDAPKDFAELIEMAQQHTADTDGDGRIDHYGLVFNQKEPFWLVPFLGAFGGWVMDEAGRPTLDTPAMARALAYLRELRAVHGIIPRECDYDMAEALFKEGKAAFLINGPWSWQGYIDAGVDLGLAPLPPIPETGRYPTPMVSAKGYSLNANARGAEREEALRLMAYLTGEAAQVDLARELGVIPSRKAAGAQAESLHPLVAASRAQILHGRAMPVVPEMRAIWDVTRPELQAVLGGGKDPARAAADMQRRALAKIAEMKGE
ncbi:MAG: extracellular solute-binding protein [Candidatus Krumholzibacteriota bacterium]|nr:extracellular solute-binding protein [Candidatus Krumholzibacteriota bacterium]